MTAERTSGEQNLVYPKDLVSRYGAKAGILLYVAQRLPDIPQAPMIVSEIGESTASIMARADAANIKWPRLFRSSAEAELVGYEGIFLTETIGPYEAGHARVAWNRNNYSIYRNPEYFESGIRQTIDTIRYSPQRMKEDGEEQHLPDEINVIVAEQSPSLYVGTYIIHPNIKGLYLITVASSSTINTLDADRTTFSFTAGEGARELEWYSAHHFGGEELENQLAQVVSWHERIAALPDMDPSWSYQVEFGIQPASLFQVRPFKPLQESSFQLPPMEPEFGRPPIVIGTTPPQGLVLRIVNADSDDPGEDCMYVGEMKRAWKAEEFQGLKAAVLTHNFGFLQHNAISIMRKAEVTVLPAGSWSDISGISEGDYIRIVSDGEHASVSKV